MQKTEKLLCVEEHVLAGGFTGAVCENLMKDHIVCDFDAIGIQNTFTETGDYIELLDKYGISAGNIAKKAKKLCQKNK